MTHTERAWDTVVGGRKGLAESACDEARFGAIVVGEGDCGVGKGVVDVSLTVVLQCLLECDSCGFGEVQRDGEVTVVGGGRWEEQGLRRAQGEAWRCANSRKPPAKAGGEGQDVSARRPSRGKEQAGRLGNPFFAELSLGGQEAW